MTHNGRLPIAWIVSFAVLLVAPATAAAEDADFAGASTDGTVVWFTTAESIVPADTDGGANDVYQRAAGVTTLVSTNSAGTASGAFPASFAGAAADGSKVFFTTQESLAASDTDSVACSGSPCIDIYERSGGTTTQTSTNTAGTANGGFDAAFGGVSADGSKVFFETEESLVAGDTDSACLATTLCIDVYERSAGTTTLVSTEATPGNQAFNAAFQGASADGSKVFFSTKESLAATDSDTGCPATTPCIDLYERSGGATVQVSTNSAENANGAIDVFLFADPSVASSTDGSKVFFMTTESLAASDTDSVACSGSPCIDVYERSGGSTVQVSTNTAGTANGARPAFLRGASADGSKVFFDTEEIMAASDSDSSEQDTYERAGAVTVHVSTNNSGNANGASDAGFSGASADGSKVFFQSETESMALSDTDGQQDVFERTGGATAQVSTNSDENANGAFGAGFAGASADGSKVFFQTSESMAASDSDTGCPTECIDVFERSGGTTKHISTNSDENANGGFFGLFKGASADGSKVFFTTQESMAASDSDGTEQDVWERSGGATTQISIGNLLLPLDVLPPNTVIGKGPKKRTPKAKAKFIFSSTEGGSRFLCKVDKKAFAACTSPKTFKVKRGKHKVLIQAIDAAGNADASPATFKWRRT